MSQETLAEIVGTTRSRVNFFMNKFRDLGLIEYNGGDITVNRSLLTVVLHEYPYPLSLSNRTRSTWSDFPAGFTAVVPIVS